MKRLLDGTVFDAVNGLWLSGLYGVAAGIGAGGIVGGTLGTIVPIAGNLVGAAIGCVVGAVVGLPAGIIGYGLSQRDGWQLGGALSCLTVGSLVAWILRVQSAFGTPTPESASVYMLQAGVALLVFTGIGVWIGGTVYSRLTSARSDFYANWRRALDRHPVEELNARQRAICLAFALAPVLLTYSQVARLLLAQQSGRQQEMYQPMVLSRDRVVIKCRYLATVLLA